MRCRSSSATSAGSFTVAVIGGEHGRPPFGEEMVQRTQQITAEPPPPGIGQAEACGEHLLEEPIRKTINPQSENKNHSVSSCPPRSSRSPANPLLAGQTQRQAAAQMGVLREVYDRWERDQTGPTVSFGNGSSPSSVPTRCRKPEERPIWS